MKFSLLECIEACVDIASYIIAEKGFKRPESYAEVFLVDNKRVLNFIKENLGDIYEFRRAVLNID